VAEEKKRLNKETEQALLNAYHHISAAIDELEAAGRVSREMSIVLTKVEEAEMWAERGFAELGYDLESIEDDGDDEDDEDDEGDDEPEEDGEEE
jgi:hypothetical protein